MKMRKITLSTLFVLIGAVGIYRINSSNFPAKVAATVPECSLRKQLKRIDAPKANVDNLEIPAVVPLNDEQRSYVSEVFWH